MSRTNAAQSINRSRPMQASSRDIGTPRTSFSGAGKLWVLAVFAAAATFGCSSKLEGSITVDGAAFEIAKCRSGQAFGFAGVQFNGKDGRRLRVFPQPDGTAHAALFASGDAPKGDNLGPCGTLMIKQQNSTINNIKNIQGVAALDCTAAGHTIKGSVKFANCH